jgi:L-lysine exporter family protein LysE/ArgO
MFDTSALLQGLALGLGMFVVPGPKDILILRQALSQRPAVELVFIGVLSDALLIWLGLAGVSAALSRAPALQTAALWVGAGLMLAHGLFAARRAFRTSDIAPAGGDVMPRAKSLAALLVVSFFNPAAWLDTVLVIGTYGAALPEARQTSFVVGAVSASCLWFLTLVTGARRAGQLVTTPKAWQVLDLFVAAVMTGLAVYVAAGLL